VAALSTPVVPLDFVAAVVVASTAVVDSTAAEVVASMAVGAAASTVAAVDAGKPELIGKARSLERAFCFLPIDSYLLHNLLDHSRNSLRSVGVRQLPRLL